MWRGCVRKDGPGRSHQVRVSLQEAGGRKQAGEPPDAVHPLPRTENAVAPSGGEPYAVISCMYGSEGGAGKRTGRLAVSTAPAPPPYWGPLRLPPLTPTQAPNAAELD